MPKGICEWPCTMAVTETVGEFRKRNGHVEMNRDGRPTTLTWSDDNFTRKRPTEKQKRRGYIYKLNQRRALPKATVRQVRIALREAKPTDIIVEIYPTHFCTNCDAPAWFFVTRYEEGHCTCTKCGCVNRMRQENVQRHLNDDGELDKGMSNITPGFDHNDTETRLNGKRIGTPGKKIPSHLRNYWRIRGTVEAIASRWVFNGIDSLIRRAKIKLKRFYYTIKGYDGKMPHGAAAIAAACFYATVLEHEHCIGKRTICTLPAIQRSAQQSRDLKKGRNTRNVTENTILRYTKILKRYGLCDAAVPEIGAKTLRFRPQSSALEHARMAIFSECAPTKFHLPKTKQWGIRIGNTNQGVLYVNSVDTEGSAFAAGIRKGDYVFQLEKEVINCDITPDKFERLVKSHKLKSSGPPVLEIAIMRKKKNVV